MLASLLNTLQSAMEQHLDGWSIRKFKYWVNDKGVEYVEAHVVVANDVLFVRLKGENNTIRLVDVELHKPQLRGERPTPYERGEGS